MPLQKQSVSFNFAQGLDLKTDPFQLAIGKFDQLRNSVFDKIGRLTKRNGFGQITSLPDGSSQFVTTFNGNLTAIGTDLKAYSPGAALWTSKGAIAPLQLSTLPLIRSNTNQTYVDTAIAPNGLICTVYTDSVTLGSTTTQSFVKYVIADSVTGQNIIPPTQIVSTFGTVSAQGRVFALANRFVVVFSASNGAISHLQYFPINAYAPSQVGSVSDFSTVYSPGSVPAFDGVVANNNLFLSWNSGSTTAAGFLTSGLALSGRTVISSNTCKGAISVTADLTSAVPTIWTAIYDSPNGYAVATNAGSVASGSFTAGLSNLFSSQQMISSGESVANITQIARNGFSNWVYEVNNTYSYDAAISSQLLKQKAIYVNSSVTASSVFMRSVGLAGKGFLIGSSSYFLTAYQSPYQPTYFIANSAGGVIAKVAYSNGGGYVTNGLTTANVSGNSVSFGYLYKDSIQAVNKNTNVAAGTQVNGIYSQTGVNLATVTFGTSNFSSSEIGNNLNFNGGFLWAYDGYQPVEQNFHLYPDSVETIASSMAGSMINQTYYYQSTYEWTDNQGNAFRSAPSIPTKMVLSSGTSVVSVYVPTLRLTYKTNPVKIVIYRWSTAQPVYYQTTPITNPLLNNPLVDSVLFSDTNSDATILGNNIIYTNGGVVEDTGGPACNALTLFDTRLWAIDSEDPNLLWYSKQVIEATPVEMSDLFTLYVSPNAGAQGSTGPMKAISPLDDKLIIFKKNAIYYLNGSGPDNTGANSQYSQPIFVTSTVGCSNQSSLVLIPGGLMFQSDKGIWLLGRELSTSYIGKDVETLTTGATVLSALAVPGTNQVRFTLSTGITLLYDYFMNQWGSFYGIPGIGSCLYNNLHTFINKYGQTYQETPGVYFDGSTPVVMSFRTGWMNLAGLQGYKRVYRMYMLGEYKTPHILTAGIAYDFNPSVVQQSTISPDNYSAPWGSDPTWGAGATWGGSSQVEQWRINFDRQQCQSFQLTFNEYYDSSIGAQAGQGLTISGINVVAGIKKASPGNVPKAHTTG